MRHAFLLRSVQRVLGEDESVIDAAYIWARHRWMIPYSAVVLAAIVLFAPIGGIEQWQTRVVLGLAGVGVAVIATTNYRVLAMSSDGLFLLKASRIRQVAIGDVERLEADIELAPIGATFLITDWSIGGRRFSVPRSSEASIERMAAASER